MKNILAAVTLAVILMAGNRASAETPWLGVVFASGELKEQIEATPIELRPNRPFHFYGNTVRRQYYRGVGIPMPRDLFMTFAALVNGPQSDGVPQQTQSQLLDRSVAHHVVEPGCSMVAASPRATAHVATVTTCLPFDRLASAENRSTRTAYELFKTTNQEVQVAGK